MPDFDLKSDVVHPEWGQFVLKSGTDAYATSSGASVLTKAFSVLYHDSEGIGEELPVEDPDLFARVMFGIGADGFLKSLIGEDR